MSQRRVWAMNRGKLRVLPLCLLAIVAGCREDEAKEPTSAAPNVVVAKATTDTVPQFLELTGRTEAPNTVSIRSRVDGHVESRPFKEGADVSEGDALFVIDQRPYAAELAQLKGTRDKSEAGLAFASREKERFTALASDGTIPQEQLDKKTTDAAQAQGDLDSSQGAVDAAQVNLDYTTVSAPINGRVGRVYQDVGNVVSANDTVLVELVQMDPLYVYISPSEGQFLELERYWAANSDLKVVITLIDGSTHPHPGKLDFSSPGVDPTTGTIAVRATFPNPDRTLRPGQYARVQVELTEQPGQVTVPAEAIGQDQAGFFVFVVGKDDKAELRRVTVGRAYQGRRIVKSGLKTGQQVVVKGQQRVRSGITVRIEPPSGDTAGSKTDG